jgi:hypothetical protein
MLDEVGYAVKVSVTVGCDRGSAGLKYTQLWRARVVIMCYIVTKAQTTANSLMPQIPEKQTVGERHRV